jgi:hypothetical protein
MIPPIQLLVQNLHNKPKLRFKIIYIIQYNFWDGGNERKNITLFIRIPRRRFLRLSLKNANKIDVRPFPLFILNLIPRKFLGRSGLFGDGNK